MWNWFIFKRNQFDMVFVFKDYHKKPVEINFLPMHAFGLRYELHLLKEWLNSHDICFSTVGETNWRNKLENILRDPKSFFDNGGWIHKSKRKELKRQLLVDGEIDRGDEENNRNGGTSFLIVVLN